MINVNSRLMHVLYSTKYNLNKLHKISTFLYRCSNAHARKFLNQNVATFTSKLKGFNNERDNYETLSRNRYGQVCYSKLIPRRRCFKSNLDVSKVGQRFPCKATYYNFIPQDDNSKL